MTRIRSICLVAALWMTAVGGRAQSPAVFINEIHYDNTGTDAGEFIEIAGPAGTSLTGYSIVLYNGSGGAVYDTDALSGTIPDQQNGFGTVVLAYPSNGIQNGGSPATPAADGIALVQDSTVVQFLSYEGTFTAVGGPANGLTSTDIGRAELGTEPLGQSLQLQGSGTLYSAFAWFGPLAQTPAQVNTGQSFGDAEEPTLSINNASVTEGDSGLVNAEFTVSLSAPAGAGGVTFDLATADGSAVADDDYQSVASSFSIAEGSSTLTIQVPVIGDTLAEADETFSATVSNVSGAVVLNAVGVATIVDDDSGPPDSTPVIINELDSDTPGTDAAEFVELYDGGLGNTSLTGLVVVFLNGSNDLSYQAIDLDGRTTDASGYFTLGNADVPGVDLVFAGNLLQNGADAVALYIANATDFPANTAITTTGLVDAVVYDTDDADDTGLLALVNSGQPQVNENEGGNGITNSIQRCPNGSGGARNTQTYIASTPTPGTTNECAAPAVPRTIAEIQGTGSTSPLVGDNVITSGIVTGRKLNGLFIQTTLPDSETAASDALFIFTSTLPQVNDSGTLRIVAIGDEVQVTGRVTEFRRTSDLRPDTLTQLSGMVTLTLLSESNPLPAALNAADIFAPLADSRSDQLERFEGMLVTSGTLRVVAPTNTFGEFYAVVDGMPRPFREPGILVGDPIPAEAPSPADINRFDGNFERIMVETDEQIDAAGLERAPLQVATGATVTGAFGPLDYAFDEYRIQVAADATLVATGGIASAISVPIAGANEFTVASANLLNFFPPNPSLPAQVEAFNNRLAKASLLIRQVLRTPIVLGVIEVGDINVLQQLRDRVNSEAGTSYEAYLLESDDDSENDQDVGYLIDLARAEVVSQPIQLFRGKTFEFAGVTDVLHDRPPFLAEVELLRPNSSQRYRVTIMLNHLRSLIDVDSTEPFLVNGQPSGFTVGARVREKRRLAAEDVADAIEARQTQNLIVLGDFNAFEFNDGLGDIVGTLQGSPAAPEEVVEPSVDRWDHQLFNLVEQIEDASDRYSYVFEGNAQVLDHVLVNTALLGRLSRFRYARTNADFPAALTSDFSRPERFSDHDIPVAYFTFPPSAGLSIAATVGAGPFTTGSSLAYSVTVANAGPDAATDVTVSIPQHSSLRFNSLVTPAGWTCTTPSPGTSGTLSCTVSQLADGASAAFEIVGTLDCGTADGALISQTASVSTTTSDPSQDDNTSTMSLTAVNPPPVITGIVTPIVAAPVPGPLQPGAVVSDLALGSPTVTDNCAGATLSRSGVPSGNLFPEGLSTVVYGATDSGGATAMATATVQVLSAVESLQVIRGEIAEGAGVNPETLLARRLGGVLVDVDRAIERLQAVPPDRAAATSRVTRAAKELEAIVKHGLIDTSQGREWLIRLVGANWLLARQAIVDATSSGGNPAALARAETFVQRGDAQVTRGEFEAASSHYEAAVGILQ